MRQLRSQAGITFVTVIFMVMLMGIMLAMTGQSWKRLMQREREEELIYRGMQVFQAISSWNRPRGGHAANMPLRELKDLCKDPRSLANVRHLRCDPAKKDPLSPVLMDPITGKEFEVVKGAGGGIVGVISPSDEAPLKTGNFPPELQHFEGKKAYKEWLFVPGRLRATLPTAIGNNPPGKLDMPSPFLPDERDKSKTK